MRTTPLFLLLLLALATLSGCRGNSGPTQSQALLEGQSGELWFCQVAEDLENWDCVRDAALAAAPVPARMPLPRQSDDDNDDPTLLDSPSRPEYGLPSSSDAQHAQDAQIAAQPADPSPTDSDVEQEAPAEEAPAAAAQAPAAAAQAPAAAAQEPAAETTPAIASAATTPTTPAYPPADTPADTLSDTPSDRAGLEQIALVELDAIPDGAFVVQLVAMESRQTLDYMVADRGLFDVFAARVAANGEVYHVLLSGPFPDEASAIEFALAPPEDLSDFQPWVRSTSSLKDAIREADQFASGTSP